VEKEGKQRDCLLIVLIFEELLKQSIPLLVFMNDFITIQDFAGATHIIFTRYITNLTLQNGTAKIHINSGGSSMTVHTKYTMKELMELILNQP
jgi:hypothetical protein